MIGQKQLVSKITTFENLPFSTIICGDYGMGKRTFLQYIIDFVGVDSIDLTNEFSDDIKNNLYTSVSPKIILFSVENNANNMSLQNSMLKLLEKPPINCKIFILVSDKSLILETVLNRCQVWELSNYTTEELKEIAKLNSVEIVDEKYLGILKTPYNIINYYDIIVLDDMYKLSVGIIENIDKANISNILSISNKINFSDDDSRFNLFVFVKILRYALNNYIKNSNDICKYVKCYNLVSDLDRDIRKFHINRKNLFEKFLLEFRGCVS